MTKLETKIRENMVSEMKIRAEEMGVAPLDLKTATP